jgi:hypothetical protein
MKNNRAYLEMAQEQADERYLSAEGDWSDANGDWTQAEGDWSDADAWTEAAGGAPGGTMAPQHMAAPEQQSPPIIIKIKNTTSSDINNVDLYDAYANYQAGVAGNFNQAAGITITSEIPNVTYLQMLANSWGKPMKIGRTVVISSTSLQAEEAFVIRHNTDYGQLIEYTVTPFIDPYQNQSDRIVESYNYILDGFTRIRFNTIIASASVVIRLYPASRFSPTNLAAGQKSGNLGWRKPVLVRPAQRYISK